MTDEKLSADQDRGARDTGRSLPIVLLRAREIVMARFRPILAAHGITEQQWRVLRVLHESGKLDAKELAHRACVLSPSLTRIVKTLGTQKLITRRKDKGDGRKLYLEIAPAGLKVIDSVSPDSQKIYAEIDATYGVEEMQKLLDMLERLAALES
ncbi:MAG: homoprotocatechuate degradation operon regulator HpaR [Rhizobiaceae bacterium]|nr:homoprotocatechuate degradation operon regulator HpaR [Rhizobiaceae bacterium]